MFAGDKIIALTQSWTFDEIFSDQLLQGFDADGDGAFDQAESKAVVLCRTAQSPAGLSACSGRFW